MGKVKRHAAAAAAADNNFPFAPPKKYSLRIRQKKIEAKLHSNFAFKLIEETKEFKVPFSRN